MLYMAVTSDKYELPIAVADDTRELASMMHKPKKIIENSIVKKLSGKRTGIKYIKVDDNIED